MLQRLPFEALDDDWQHILALVNGVEIVLLQDLVQFVGDVLVVLLEVELVHLGLDVEADLVLSVREGPVFLELEHQLDCLLEGHDLEDAVEVLIPDGVSLVASELLQLRQGEVADQEVVSVDVAIDWSVVPATHPVDVLVLVLEDVGGLFQEWVMGSHQVAILGELEVELDEIDFFVVSGAVTGMRMLREQAHGSSVAQDERVSLIGWEEVGSRADLGPGYGSEKQGQSCGFHI